MNIREISIFKNLTEVELSYIQEKLRIEEKFYKKDANIFREGEVSKDIYYLIKGSILVYKIDANGKRFIIKRFDKSEIFGEVYSYLGQAFDFSAVAETNSEILILHDFRKLFNYELPNTFLKSYINLLSKKCLQLSLNNQITSQSSLRNKIVKYLILNQKNSLVKMDYSREDWSDILATTRPSLSRELSNMVDDGLIKIKEKSIEIIDLDKLVEII